MNTFRWRYAVYCVLVFLGALCGAPPSAEAKQLTVWAWDPNFNVSIMKQAAARYKKLHPDFEIEIVEMTSGGLEQKLQTVLMARVPEVMPDIVLLEDYVVRRFLQAFPGAFEPLSDHIDFSNFARYKLASATLNGKVYAVPFDSGVVGLFYRKDYFAEAGYSPKDMEDLTWDQYIEMGKVLKEKTGKHLIGLGLYDINLLRPMLQSAGLWFFDDKGDLNIVGNPVLKEGLVVTKQLFDNGLVQDMADWSEFIGGFTSGKTATVVTGVWIGASIRSQADQAGKWGVAPMPRFAGIPSSINASNNGGGSWLVPTGRENRDLAIDFLNTIYAGDIDFYQEILAKNYAFGSFLPARDGDRYREPDAFFGGEYIWQKFSRWLEQVPPVNYGIFSPEVIALFGPEIYAVIRENKPIDAALRDLDKKVRFRTQIQTKAAVERVPVQTGPVQTGPVQTGPVQTGNKQTVSRNGASRGATETNLAAAPRSRPPGKK